MQYENITRAWLQDTVIALNLCPFAQQPFAEGRVRFQLCLGTELEDLYQSLLQALADLLEQDPAVVETTLLIHPMVLQDFADYNDFLGLADELLESAGLEGIIQLASFHPQYQFADAPPDDPANYTNRSPFPMLHLLREASVSAAISHYPTDTADIPARNIARLRGMSAQEIAERWRL